MSWFSNRETPGIRVTDKHSVVIVCFPWGWRACCSQCLAQTYADVQKCLNCYLFPTFAMWQAFLLYLVSKGENPQIQLFLVILKLLWKCQTCRDADPFPSHLNCPANSLAHMICFVCMYVFFLLDLLFYMYDYFACMHQYVPSMCLVPTEEGIRPPWNWGYR